MIALVWGRHLYVDNVSTLAAECGAGHADRLMTWLEKEAQRFGCEGLHSDSEVAENRACNSRIVLLPISTRMWSGSLPSRSC